MQSIPLLTAIGTGLGVAGSLSSASYQRQVAKNNEIIARQNAQQAIAESRLAAKQGDEAALLERGALTAQMGASGLSLGMGSSLLRSRALQRTIDQNRRATIYAGETESVNFLNQAQEFRGQGQAAMVQGVLGAGESLISGAIGVNKAKLDMLKTKGS